MFHTELMKLSHTPNSGLGLIPLLPLLLLRFVIDIKPRLLEREVKRSYFAHFSLKLLKKSCHSHDTTVICRTLQTGAVLS